MSNATPPETGIRETPIDPAPTATTPIDPAPTGAIESPSEPAADTVIPLPPLPPVEVKPPDPRWTAFDMFLFVLVATLAFFLGSTIAYNPDIWMTLATGRLFAAGEHTFGPDPFAFGSDPREPWVNHSWLYALSQYLLYGIGGETVLVVVKALLGVALLVVFLGTRSRDSSRFTALELGGLALLALSPRLLLGSVTVSYLMFGLTLYVLYRSGALGGRGDDDPPSTQALWWLPPLFVLWVNLDAWFFLGPLTVLLCWLGNLLGRALAYPSPIDLGKLGLATLLSFAACLLNPFHYHAFALPPEFAYLVRGVLPGTLTGGGTALQGLLRFDPTLMITYDLLSPLSSSYWSEPTKGLNVAGLAYFLLLVVSAVSFVPALLQSTRIDGVQLSVARLLVWAVPMALSIWQVRMIPFFAVVAAPIAALNFADVARWWRRQPGAGSEPVLSPHLARFAVTVMVLVALGLAWPGWLHGPIGQESRRHVAWEIHSDPAHRAAAETLARRHAQGKAERVFNFNFSLPSYVAWHAPGVRCCVDHRLTLFAQEAPRYARARAELEFEAKEISSGARMSGNASGPPPTLEWPQSFREWKVDHIAVHNLHNIRDPFTGRVAMMCWLQPWQWRQLEAAGSTLLFEWSPRHDFPASDVTAMLNRLAYGPVPEAERAPLEGTEPPQGEPPLWQQYLHPSATALELDATEPYVWWHYFNTTTQRWRIGFMQAEEITRWAASAGLGGAAPGSVLGTAALFQKATLTQQILYMAQMGGDNGPPGAGLVMIRDARRAVAANNYDPYAQQALYVAYDVQGNGIEEHWINRLGNAPRTLRSEVRDIQLVTALRNYLDLRPDDWQRRIGLAKLLAANYMLDAGLETYTVALKTLEKIRTRQTDRRVIEAIRDLEKREIEFYKEIERDVKRRRADFELRAARFKNDPMQKFRLAVRAPYQTVDANNKDVVDPRGMGLALEGLKQLQSVPPESLNAQEKGELYFFKFRLLIQQGRLAEASHELVPSALPQEWYFACALYQAAAMGDYKIMDGAVAKMEQNVPLGLRMFEGHKAMVGMLATPLPQWRLVYDSIVGNVALNYLQTAGHLATMRTFRGLMALEVGDTALAEQHFAEAMRVGGEYFADRPIAQRCLELIRAEKKNAEKKNAEKKQ